MSQCLDVKQVKPVYWEALLNRKPGALRALILQKENVSQDDDDAGALAAGKTEKRATRRRSAAGRPGDDLCAAAARDGSGGDPRSPPSSFQFQIPATGPTRERPYHGAERAAASGQVGPGPCASDAHQGPQNLAKASGRAAGRWPSFDNSRSNMYPKRLTKSPSVDLRHGCILLFRNG